MAGRCGSLSAVTTGSPSLSQLARPEYMQGLGESSVFLIAESLRANLDAGSEPGSFAFPNLPPLGARLRVQNFRNHFRRYMR
jgi:hypothetical protein